MPPSEPAILRALEGLADRSGRTVVILGGPGSGKTSTLARLRSGVEALGGRTVQIVGTYRGRSVPYAALEGLERPALEEKAGDEDDEAPDLDLAAMAPMAPVAIDPEAIVGSRRRDGRVRTTFFGEPTRGRGPAARNPDDYWNGLLTEFRGPTAHPVALLVDEAAYLDVESREFVLSLSGRARLGPLLIAVSLDATSSAAAVWEEGLLGRSDVDWVRLPNAPSDPREVRRLRELTADLPAPTARALGYVTLLGGETTSVVLARIARLSLGQLAEALRPAVELGLLKVREGKVAVPDRSSVPIYEGLFSEGDRRRWHLDVADGLHALSAEPPLSRRIEIARHYLAASADALAMARLLEAAEISLGLLEFDGATRLLAEAIECLATMAPAGRAAIEPEMHLLNARALFYSGCPVEGEAELREGVEGALRASTSSTDLASWLEPLLPVLQVVGPRPSLATTIVELAERLHDANHIEPEVLLETLLPGFDAEKNQPERSRAEALRAAQHAHRVRERHLQALGLFTMGVSRMQGTVAEMAQAERFLRASRYLLRDTRRWELDYIAGEYECRLLELRGAVDQGLALRQQSIAALARARLPSVELFHELGIARVHLDRGAAALADGPLDRAARLADSLHLFPPSPGLLQLWLLDGRRYAVSNSLDAARDRWSALVDLPPILSLPRLRAEALLRLALLEEVLGRSGEVERLIQELETPETAAALPEAWRPWVAELPQRAPKSQHGGAPLPGTGPSGPPERRERRRR